MIGRLFPFRLTPQVAGTDWVLIILFALIGALGITRFPSYKISSDIVNDISYFWMLPLFVFNILMIFRQIRKCFFETKNGLISAFVICLFLSIFSIAVFHAAEGFEDVRQPASNVVAFGGLASILIITQGWIAFEPDLQYLKGRLLNLRWLLDEILWVNERRVENVEFAKKLCVSFDFEISEHLNQPKTPQSVQKRLRHLKGYVAEVNSALLMPTEVMRHRLQKISLETYNETE